MSAEPATALCGYYLPGVADVPEQVRTYGSVDVRLPVLTPTLLQQSLDHAVAVSAQLRATPIDQILARLAAVIASWQQPSSPWRQRALAALPAVTGFSAPMIAHGLPTLFAPFQGDALAQLLDMEFGGRQVLDAFHAGRRVRTPALITHILAGNIPGLALSAIILSLALKSAVCIKTASGDPLTAVLVAESIRAVDETLAQCVVVGHWRGGAQAVERVAFQHADTVVAMGSDAAIADIAPRVPGRYIGHGHKVSCALIGREYLDDDAQTHTMIEQCAYDISLWDQQGCLSPQIYYVEAGGRVSPAVWSARLGAALDTYTHTLPPRALTFDEQAAVQHFRQEAEWRGDATLRCSTESTAWSIAVEHGAAFRPTCLHRCVRIHVVPDLALVPATLAPHRQVLEAAGLAVGAARRQPIAEMLVRAGVHRVCACGTMQHPPLSWQQGGHPRLADWVEWSAWDDSSGSGN